jgi:probable FeS assembly SUF system protein SufT
MDDVKLLRDVIATRIPSGEETALRAGDAFAVTQALGGTVTVRDAGGLYRIATTDLDALGPQWAKAAGGPVTPVGAGPFSEETVWDALRQCFDPEIPLNIVDLGLVYDLACEERPDGRYDVGVKMTLTASGCGMGPTIAADARARIEAIPAVAGAHVDIIWDPQWTPHMISPEGRKVLGLD